MSSPQISPRHSISSDEKFHTPPQSPTPFGQPVEFTNTDSAFDEVQPNAQPQTRVFDQTDSMLAPASTHNCDDIQAAAVPEIPAATISEVKSYDAQDINSRIANSEKIRLRNIPGLNQVRKEMKDALSSTPENIPFVADTEWVTRELPLCLKSGLSKQALLALYNESNPQRGLGHRNLTPNDQKRLETILNKDHRFPSVVNEASVVKKVIVSGPKDREQFLTQALKQFYDNPFGDKDSETIMDNQGVAFL